MKKANSTVYGHLHLGFIFCRLLELYNDGFIYCKKHYQWKDIEKIIRKDSVFWNLLFYQAGTPIAYIYLKDGSKMRIRGRVLQKKGEKSNINPIRSTTKTYDEFISFLESKISQ